MFNIITVGHTILQHVSEYNKLNRERIFDDHSKDSRCESKPVAESFKILGIFYTPRACIANTCCHAADEMSVLKPTRLTSLRFPLNPADSRAERRGGRCSLRIQSVRSSSLCVYISERSGVVDALPESERQRYACSSAPIVLRQRT